MLSKRMGGRIGASVILENRNENAGGFTVEKKEIL